MRDAALYVIVPAILLLAGSAWVCHRVAFADHPALQIRGDALQYILMVKGEPASAPFKYRLLVPWLAHLLPLPPATALRVISYGSLFAFYALSLLLCRIVGISRRAAALSVAAVSLSGPVLYQYHNPYLTDAFQLAVLTGLLCALLARRYALFSALAVVAVLARETSIALIAASTVSRKWLGALMLVVCAITLVVVHVSVPSNQGMRTQFAQGLRHPDAAAHPFLLLHTIVYTWNYLWLTGLLGIAVAPRMYRSELAAAFALLGCVGVATSFVATDTERMLGILAPALCATTACSIDYVFRQRYGRVVMWLWAGLGIAFAWASMASYSYAVITGQASILEIRMVSAVGRFSLYAGAMMCAFTLSSYRLRQRRATMAVP